MIKAIIQFSPAVTNLQKDAILRCVTAVTNPTEADVVLAVGGDGTMLKAIHNNLHAHGPSLPLIGINLGHLGFLLNEVGDLSDLSAESFELLVNEAKPIDCKLIEAVIEVDGKVDRTLTAFNDNWISTTGPHSIKMKVSIDDKEIPSTIVGDGLIVSTPQGSSGYAHAGGGRIMKVNEPLVQITPKCCKLNYKVPMKPWCESNESQIRVEFEEKEYRPVRIYNDGHDGPWNDFNITAVTFRRAHQAMGRGKVTI